MCKPYNDLRFGDVSKVFETSDVKCSGTELRIEDCPQNDAVNCGKNEGAGVVCGGDFSIFIIETIKIQLFFLLIF